MGTEEAKALQSNQSSQRTLNLIQLITQFVMFFLRNFCQRHKDTNHSGVVMLTYISQAYQLIARDRTRTRPRASIYSGVLSSHVQNVI